MYSAFTYKKLNLNCQTFNLKWIFISKLVVKTSGRRAVGFVIFGALSHVWLLRLYIPGEQMEKSTQAGAVVWHYSSMHCT